MKEKVRTEGLVESAESPVSAQTRVRMYHNYVPGDPPFYLLQGFCKGRIERFDR